MEPFVRDILAFEDGVYLDVHGSEEPHLVHGSLYMGVSDLPASRKANGLRGPTSKEYPCPYCYQSFDSLTSAECFNPTCFRMRDDWRYIKYAYKARDADADLREEIAERRGVRWSVLDALPGWMPARSSPPEFMHATFLVQVKHMFQEVLVGSGLFTTRSRNDKPVSKLEEFLQTIWWPASSGRVPQKITEGGSVKADQWRNLVHILPVVLYYAWQVKGSIPEGCAPRPNASSNAGKALAKKEDLIRSRQRAHLAAQPGDVPIEAMEAINRMEIDRNYRRHYENALEMCTAIRIWASSSISPQEVERAQDCHSRACQSWATMNCHLTPYFHLATHNSEFFLRNGPSYSWWAYPYERNNGFLGRFKTNGHTGGELEATMMRGWVKCQLIQDLV
ncbi:uncharacterized protein B0H18DRAFT_1083280 [Fomitopsis serialis]|uniref:uncharacterized protein n=1 Tax=Fomitopsis serialis TaxID=139415 RepID=UPI002008CED2|nr:uncharacterized protein B0H18DRAFT_1083280 [Neoantrodia serialis]KAH9932537.1 hypothetical protein B0H18DRAFT_1083280 [Neoantrodia serialis]